MDFRRRIAWAGLAAALAVTAVAAQEPLARTFKLPGRGSFRFVVPDKWKASGEVDKSLPSVYVTVDPRNKDVNVQITAAPLDSAQMTTMNENSLRRFVEGRGKGLLSQSEEASVDLQPLNGPGSSGFYYTLTDRAPSKTGYKYLLQGAQRTGNLLVLFTILHRAPNAPEVAQALEMLRSATHEE